MNVKKLALCAVSSVTLLMASFAIPQDPQPQDPNAVQTKIRKLMELTGAADMGKQAMDQMLDAFQSMQGLPEGFVAKFKEVVKPADLIDIVVPIYEKHLDEATLDAAIAFASTPEGKKFHAAQPRIMQESMEAGQAWGQQAAMKVMRELGR